MYTPFLEDKARKSIANCILMTDSRYSLWCSLCHSTLNHAIDVVLRAIYTLWFFFRVCFWFKIIQDIYHIQNKGPIIYIYHGTYIRW